MILLLLDQNSIKNGASSRGRNGDSFGLRFCGLGQSEREHALLERGLDFFRVDSRGQLVALCKRETLTLAAMDRVAFGCLDFAFGLHRQGIRCHADVDVFLAQPGQLGPERQRLTGIGKGDPWRVQRRERRCALQVTEEPIELTTERRHWQPTRCAKCRKPTAIIETNEHDQSSLKTDDNLARAEQHPPTVTERSQLLRTVLSAGNERNLSITPAADKGRAVKKSRSAPRPAQTRWECGTRPRRVGGPEGSPG